MSTLVPKTCMTEVDDLEEFGLAVKERVTPSAPSSVEGAVRDQIREFIDGVGSSPKWVTRTQYNILAFVAIEQCSITRLKELLPGQQYGFTETQTKKIQASLSIEVTMNLLAILMFAKNLP